MSLNSFTYAIEGYQRQLLISGNFARLSFFPLPNDGNTIYGLCQRVAQRRDQSCESLRKFMIYLNNYGVELPFWKTGGRHFLDTFCTRLRWDSERHELMITAQVPSLLMALGCEPELPIPIVSETVTALMILLGGGDCGNWRKIAAGKQIDMSITRVQAHAGICLQLAIAFQQIDPKRRVIPKTLQEAVSNYQRGKLRYLMFYLRALRWLAEQTEGHQGGVPESLPSPAIQCGEKRFRRADSAPIAGVFMPGMRANLDEVRAGMSRAARCRDTADVGMS